MNAVKGQQRRTEGPAFRPSSFAPRLYPCYPHTVSTPELLHWKPVPPPKPVTLAGRTVTLEPLNAEKHAAALWQAIRGHDNVWTWLHESPHAEESTFRASVATRQSSPDFVFLAIVPKSTGLAAGWASYMRWDPANGVIEVGSILYAPALQRTTAATEAMYLMARHVFEDLGYRRYEWKCNAENLPSRRAAQRLGFTFEGIFRQHQVVKGRNRDTAWFSILDHEWPARKRAFESWLNPGNFDHDGRQRLRLEGIVASLK
jgi:RimJ/RimL family protein N-acetyltransferase